MSAEERIQVEPNADQPVVDSPLERLRDAPSGLRIAVNNELGHADEFRRWADAIEELLIDVPALQAETRAGIETMRAASAEIAELREHVERLTVAIIGEGDDPLTRLGRGLGPLACLQAERDLNAAESKSLAEERNELRERLATAERLLTEAVVHAKDQHVYGVAGGVIDMSSACLVCGRLTAAAGEVEG